MSLVLRKLHQEVFVLNLVETVPDSLELKAFDPVVINEHEIEVVIHKQNSLNQLFAELSAAGIHVNSMRNKSNRLEELFMRLVDRRELERTREVAEPEQAI